MTTCEACGNVVPEGNAFCTSCGAALPAPAPAEKPAAGIAPGGTDGDLLSWERKIPLITNPYLVIQCIAIPSGIGFVLGLVFWLITGAQEMLLMFVVLGGFLALVFLLVMLVLQIVTGGGLLTTFFISSEGVAHKAGSMTRSLDRAATAGSVLLGSMGGTGAGLLAMSQECNVLEWKDDPVHLGVPVRTFPRVPVPAAHQPGCAVLHGREFFPRACGGTEACPGHCCREPEPLTPVFICPR